MPINLSRLWNRQNATPASLAPASNPQAGFTSRTARNLSQAGMPGYAQLSDVLPGYSAMGSGLPATFTPGVGAPRRPAGGTKAQQATATRSSIPQTAYNADHGVFTAPYPALLGRSGGGYTQTTPTGRQGPLPKLAPGTGRRGAHPDPGTAVQTGAYQSQIDYQPVPFAYAAPHDPRFSRIMPNTIKQGTDGIGMVGTYRAHDFTPANYIYTQFRSAAMWEQLSFPTEFRNLLQYQQVGRYNLYQAVQLARPLSSADYFAGYRMDPSQYGGGGYGQLPLGAGKP